MAGRWMLERAGITNVYQYGEEVLHFGGGRLLLRGVNGSGKSTAMNMLLPFLLEADTRRIDAAGEQAGVLRSWMLSGRDEQQPQGYLWVEFAHGTEHLTFGCGIRANRSTDRVTTWWFITAKRPDIDFRLVEGRRPLSADALRAVLEPGAVYSHDQRAGYRSEVRSRLFLGADLDQHLRLLHVVRNPRVGDRIDVDLPQYLTDALPQLSEVALDDAAQPLEDLEEHRRNVEDLERTAAALRAIEDVYRNYARAELHRAADHALALVQERARAERTEKQAWTAWQAVVAAFDEAGAEHRAMIAEARRLDDEIRNLEASDAYQAGASLNDLRHHVDTLASEVGRATEDVERSDVRTAAAERAVISAQSDADAEHDHLRSALSDLADDAAASALTARPPAAPALTSHRIRDDSPLVAIGPLEPDPVRVGLAEVRAAAHQRVGDVGAVRAALADVSLAEDELRQSERRRDEAEEAEGAAADAFAEARRALQQAVEQWRRALDQWTTTLAEHRRRHELSPMLLPVVRDGADDSALEPEQARASWLDLVERTIDHHRRDRADLAARRSAHDEVIAELEAELGELISRTLPKPPTAPWQRRTGVPCLAELIDFAPDLPAEQRADLEGAMEAAGLLGAELADHGALVLADGSLAVRAGTTAARAPLAALLVVAIPPGTASTIGYPRVQRVLDAISTDSIDATDGQTVVTTDGHFQIGPLQGRHTKPEAEHIGASARRAALDRQRAQARRELDEAIELRDQIDQATDVVNGRLAEADALRRDLPSTAALAEATTRSDLTEASLETARDLLAGRRDEVVRADQVHGVRVDAATRTAATLGLPTDRGELDRVTATLRGIASGCDRAETFIAAVVKAVAHWIARTTEWEIAVDDETLRTNTLARLRDEHRDRASKLATLEDAVSADYDDIVQTIKTSQADLKNAAARRDQAREAELARSASAGGAGSV